MDKVLMNAASSAKPSNETKADATTRVAREIMASETAARKAKSERLRAARLAQEAAARAAPATKKARRKP